MPKSQFAFLAFRLIDAKLLAFLNKLRIFSKYLLANEPKCLNTS